jgi:hypothetical protein
MNLMKKYLHRILLVTFISILPVFLFAQSPTQGPGNPSQGPNCMTSGLICNPINAESLNEIIKVILEGMIKIGIPIIALALVYCGFLFVSATGNSEKLKTAKRALLYTLIGAAILLGSWAIAQLISETVLAL